MNQLPENSLCIYDVTLVTLYLIGLGGRCKSPISSAISNLPRSRSQHLCAAVKNCQSESTE